MAARATPLRLLVLLGLAAPATAHLGGGEGVIPFVEGGVVVGAGTTWGLIGGAPGGYSQTCEEAIGDTPRDFVRVQDGAGARVFAATGQGVVVSADNGCAWETVPGTAGRAVLALTRVGGRLVAITADPGVENHVLVSEADGASFVAAHTGAVGVLLTSLAAGGDGAILVAGADTVAARPVLLHGDPGALTPLPVPLLDGATLARALAVDDDALWFSFLDGIGRGHLVRVPRVDGAPLPDEAVDVGAFDGLVRATGTAGGLRFAIAASGVLFRTVDDGAGIAPDGWSRTTEGPLACLRRVDGDDRLWGCATQLDAVWFKATRDGLTWEAVLPFDDVADRTCPADSPAAGACASRLAPPGDDEPAGEVDDAPAPVAPGCAGGAVTSWWLLPLVLRRRRR